MFKWAKRQKLSSEQKNTPSKHSKFQSPLSKPSNISTNRSTNRKSTRDTESSVEKRISNFIMDPCPSSKQLLIQAFNEKYRQKVKIPSSKPFRYSCDKKKRKNVGSFEVENFHLWEFCGVYTPYQNHKWNQYVVGKVLEGLGLINDLVHDRLIISNLWEVLECPDLLSLYVFVELCLDGSINLCSAYKHIKPMTNQYLDIRKADRIYKHRVASSQYLTLKRNRISRKNTSKHSCQ